MSKPFKLIILLVFSLQLIPSSALSYFGLRHAAYTILLGSTTLFFCHSFSRMRFQNNFEFAQKLYSILVISSTMVMLIFNAADATLYLEGYKFFIIFIMIFASSEISKVVPTAKLLVDCQKILSLYTLSIFTFIIATGLQSVLTPTGAGGIYTRLNVTGSVTSLGISAVTSVMLSLPRLKSEARITTKLLALITSIAAIYIMMLCASRQTLLILAIFSLIHLISGNITNRRELIRKLEIFFAITLSLTIFLIFSIFVNNSMFIRLFENPSSDYSSGRFSSITTWLKKMDETGAPLGLGHIRNNVVEEIELLWPHNEIIRFYIEAGIPGSIIILTLIIYGAIATLRTLKSSTPLIVKNTAIALFSVMIVQINLDNFINNIFLSAPIFLILSICANQAHSTTSQLKKA